MNKRRQTVIEIKPKNRNKKETDRTTGKDRLEFRNKNIE